MSVSAQDKQIDSKRSELMELKSEIQSIESELMKSSARERQSVQTFDKLNRQNFLINRVVLNLKKEEEQKAKEITFSEKRIAALENEIDKLKKNYAKYVTSIYKGSKINEWEILLNSKSFNQAVLRYKYLKEFSRQRKNDLDRFNETKEELVAAKKQLEIERAEKRRLADEKSTEEKSLKAKLADQKKIVDRVKKDKAVLTGKLREKKNAEKQIANLVAKLVEEAERKQRELEQRKDPMIASTNPDIKSETYPEYTIDLSTSAFKSFSELKGKLNWPVRRGKIIQKFGETTNPALRTVTMNNGVDIRAAGDLNVLAVVEGVVSAVEWIPGYGSVVIVSHRGNFRTVYSHLSEIFVNEGDRVSTGTVLARVAEGLDGTILHFEIWNSRSNVNPEQWLRKL
jgi:murein hydrolase activator